MKTRHIPAVIAHDPWFVVSNWWKMLSHTFRGSSLRSVLGLESDHKVFERYRNIRSAERAYSVINCCGCLTAIHCAGMLNWLYKSNRFLSCSQALNLTKKSPASLIGRAAYWKSATRPAKTLPQIRFTIFASRSGVAAPWPMDFSRSIPIPAGSR